MNAQQSIAIFGSPVLFHSNVQPPRKASMARKQDWKCPSCGKTLRYYWLSCPEDGTERPEE